MDGPTSPAQESYWTGCSRCGALSLENQELQRELDEERRKRKEGIHLLPITPCVTNRGTLYLRASTSDSGVSAAYFPSHLLAYRYIDAGIQADTEVGTEVGV